jgi:hypothetical protein
LNEYKTDTGAQEINFIQDVLPHDIKAGIWCAASVRETMATLFFANSTRSEMGPRTLHLTMLPTQLTKGGNHAVTEHSEKTVPAQLSNILSVQYGETGPSSTTERSLLCATMLAEIANSKICISPNITTMMDFKYMFHFSRRFFLFIHIFKFQKYVHRSLYFNNRITRWCFFILKYLNDGCTRGQKHSSIFVVL